MSGIIHEEKFSIKAIQQALIAAAPALVVVLVGTLAFGLGRLSAEDTKSKVVLYERALAPLPPRAVGGMVVGSRSGSKYHFPWCPGALTMNEGNKVWFADEAEARRRGYTPAGNCEGLQ